MVKLKEAGSVSPMVLSDWEGPWRFRARGSHRRKVYMVVCSFSQIKPLSRSHDPSAASMLPNAETSNDNTLAPASQAS